MKDVLIEEDINKIINLGYGKKFSGSTVVISGATGIIGQYLVRAFLTIKNCQVIALARNEEKARKMFNDCGDRLEFIFGNICEISPRVMYADYIIHCASITDSLAFIHHPVEVIDTAISGTKNMLEIARINNVKGFVFLSTMEVYGSPDSDDLITEEHETNINTMDVRSSYPESKRMCESLCNAYYKEFGVPTYVLRLSQTFGPGVRYDDGRIFAYLGRCVIENIDIVLHTTGETKRSYLYVADACSAILSVLERGEAGHAYNVTNEDNYMNIRDMAELVASECAKDKIKVVVNADEKTAAKMGYASVLKMNLSTEKIRRINWHPETDIVTMFNRMIMSMRTKRECQ